MNYVKQANGHLYADVLNHGHVVLEQHMGGDLEIANAARMSYAQDSDEMDERNEGLLNFLVREKHETPLEMVSFKFDIKAPIFVFREWHRHRIGVSINEQSGRYSELEREFYVPERDWVRKRVGKPGNYSYDRIDDDVTAEAVRDLIDETQGMAFDQYEAMVKAGVALEVARVVLPVGTYSRMKWKCNLRSLMHFLLLRNDPRAQKEIRAFAKIMEEMAFEIAPVAMAAFVKHNR